MRNVDRFIYSLETIDDIVEILYQRMNACRVMTFVGSLGAGKTTLVKKLLQRCGVDEVITSPTYTYVNKYANGQGHSFYHYDLYRVSNLDELFDLGLQEYIYTDNGWSFIEWPEVVSSLLDHDVCRVTLDYGPEMDTRICTID